MPELELALTDARSANADIRKAMLVEWVMSRVERWRRHRDQNYAKRWAEYYRLWRGFYSTEDKNRDSERSQLIAPALQQAIEMTVAEMEEASFGRDQWIDVSDDVQDENKQDAEIIRDFLIEDFDWAGVPAAVAEIYLNGAIYGTGIGKIMYGTGTVSSMYTDEYGASQSDVMSRPKVWLEPVHPMSFVIDPASKKVDDGLGAAHELVVPKHRITMKQATGKYYQSPLGEWTGEDMMVSETGKLSSARDIDHTESVFITEYHGLVPKKFLDENYDPANDEDLVLKDEHGSPIIEDGELVEAIITIANKSTLLKDVENPYTMKDRCFLAYQHETVPNQFWGRGVAEKGYNPQKALDAELRARIDALGLLTYPIMGADATRLPRGLDLRLRPGKMFLVNGRPSEVLEPITFGNLDPATFQNSSDLERMVQMGTGAMDTAIPSAEQRRNETVGGMGMLQSGFLKRAKRTMANVESHFLKPLVNKALWRYMQFSPDRYPTDYELVVNGTMGIMAREFEVTQLTQLLQAVPPESPVFMMILKAILDNSTIPSRGHLKQALEQMLQPNPEQEEINKQMQQLAMQKAALENQELQAKAIKMMAEAERARAQAEHEGVKANLEDDKVEIMAAQTVIANKKEELNRQNTMIQAQDNERQRKHEKEMGFSDMAFKAYEGESSRRHESSESDKDRKSSSREASRERSHKSRESSRDRGASQRSERAQRKFESAESARERRFNKAESQAERKSKETIAKNKPKPIGK